MLRAGGLASLADRAAGVACDCLYFRALEGEDVLYEKEDEEPPLHNGVHDVHGEQEEELLDEGDAARTNRSA